MLVYKIMQRIFLHLPWKLPGLFPVSVIILSPQGVPTLDHKYHTAEDPRSRIVASKIL